jgi:hypothetical protein
VTWLRALLVVATCLLVPACGSSSGDETGSDAAAADSAIEPPPDARWQYQLEAADRGHEASGRIDVGICRRPYEGPAGGECVRPRVIDFDPYLDDPDTNPDTTLNTRAVDALHDRGGYAICYVDAGSIERYRPDFERFRRWDRSHGGSLLGNPFSKRFPNERWANVGGAEQREFLLQMMEQRTANCEQAGFDAVEYDVVAAHESGKRVTGFDVSARDQLAYNRGLAAIGHEHGLAVGLKNDLGQVRQLVDDFDFAVNEECAGYDECKLLKPFVAAGKPVFHVEYTLPPRRFCAATEGLGFNSIKKAADYSLRNTPWTPCS